VSEDGSLTPFQDEAMISAAKSKNAVPMMSITNFSSTAAGSNVAHTVLANPEIRDKTLNNIIQVMDEKGYQRLNIDFENVLPEDRELYNQFLQLAVDHLH